MPPKDAYRMENSKTVIRILLFWSALFGQSCLAQYLEFLRCHYFSETEEIPHEAGYDAFMCGFGE